MKKHIKELIPAIILAFVTSFMLFIYEPIVMYSNNASDFWFNIFTLLHCTIIIFSILFIIIITGYIVLYILERKVFKNKFKIYNIGLLIGYILFIVTYIQGNFMSGSLPVLDGKEIEWSNYTRLSLISLLLLVACSAAGITAAIKLKFEKTIKILKYISCTIFLMLIVSLISTCSLKKDWITKKQFIATATAENLNDYSENQNLIVLLLDSIDSETFENIIQNNEEYKSIFDDFTYYPDTVGGYAFTRDSVPLLLSGYWNENEKKFNDFCNEAMDNSKLLEVLKEKDYNINIYYNEITYNTENAKNVKNFSFDSKVDLFKFIKQEIKYDLFKYLPYYLKKFSRVEGMNFNYTRKITNEEVFMWENTVFYNDYLSQEVMMGKENEFKYIHLEGAHYPFNSDKDLNEVENGTYEGKIEASIKLIDKYLTYLKENDIFDNSAIIILADHGFGFDIEKEDLLKRQNPILYIKGINEKHERQISEEKVSFGDFQDICIELLDGKKTKDLFESIDTNKPRRFLLQYIGSYDYMEEFLQYGKSKDLDTLKETGNVFER